MGKAILLFAAGMLTTAALFIAASAWHYYSTRPAQLSAQICGAQQLDALFVKLDEQALHAARKGTRKHDELNKLLAQFEAIKSC